MENNKINIGLVGLGYWGPNWLRNIMNHSKFNLSWISDMDKNKLSKYFLFSGETIIIKVILSAILKLITF